MNQHTKTTASKVVSSEEPRPTLMKSIGMVASIPYYMIKNVTRDEYTKKLSREYKARQMKKGRGTSGSW